MGTSSSTTSSSYSDSCLGEIDVYPFAGSINSFMGMSSMIEGSSKFSSSSFLTSPSATPSSFSGSLIYSDGSLGSYF